MIQTMMDKLLGPAEPGPWALLDCPVHSNVGDSAIWLGTLAILENRFRQPPSFVTRYTNFPHTLDRVMPTGPIFLLGGGNFGDLWPGYWENRVALLRRHQDRKIVQLPQSIQFATLSGAPLRETKSAIANHPDFTLLVRDQPSLDFAKEHFDCVIHLCPDLALGLGPLTASEPPNVPVIALMREDIEKRTSNGQNAGLSEWAKIQDWVDADRQLLSDRIVPRIVRLAPGLMPQMMGPLEAAFRRQATRTLQRGIDVLAQGEVVVTDRLHGHILCCLLGKRHILLDNENGKVFSYATSWPETDLTIMASGVDEAIAQLRKIS